jgi:GTP-binding protein
MVDGCVMLVDARRGRHAADQVRAGKALKMGLRRSSCINKVDRPDADPGGA